MKSSRLVHLILFTLAVLFVSVTEFFATVRVSAISGFQETPANHSRATGTGSVILNSTETQVKVTLYVLGLTGPQTSAAIHGPAQTGNIGPAIINLPIGNFTQDFTVTPQQAADLKAGLWYFQVRSSSFPMGEIRGQITETAGTQVVFPWSSGALDTTFGSSGMVSTNLGPANDVAQAVAIQPDGKIVVAGYGSNGTNNDFAVVRYNPDGSLDETFDGSSNGNGIVLTPIGTSEDEAFGIALQPDGKIVLAGQTRIGAETDIAVARFNADGTLDSAFDGDGRAIVGRPGMDIARSVAIQTDGKIVVAGDVTVGSNSDIAVIRFNPNGSLDSDFDGNAGNGNGIVTTPVGTSSDIGYGVVIQPDGRIVVAGYYSGEASTDTTILRYATDGRMDTSFSGDGIFTFSFSPNNTDEALSVALQSDGKIVFAGCIRTVGANDFLFARITSVGQLDTSFGSGGSLIVPFGSSADIGLAVAVQPDGKIIGSGFGNSGVDNDFAIARVNPNGTLDATFDGDGKVQTRFGPFTDSANAVAIQADGKIVAAGRAVGDTADFGVARYGYGTNSQGNDGFVNLNPTTAIRFDNAFAPGASSSVIVNSAALPPLPAPWSFIGSPRVVSTSASFSGAVLVRITLPASTGVDDFNAVRVFQYDSGAWVDRTAVAPPRDFAAKSVYARVSSLSIFAATLPTPAATQTANISGRLSSALGHSVSPAVVTLTNSGGARFHTAANPFGYFRITTLDGGQNYILNVGSKRNEFAPRLISLNGDMLDLDLRAQR